MLILNSIMVLTAVAFGSLLVLGAIIGYIVLIGVCFSKLLNWWES